MNCCYPGAIDTPVVTFIKSSQTPRSEHKLERLSSACRAITKEHSRPIPDGIRATDMHRPLFPILQRKLLVIARRSCSKFRGGSKERWMALTNSRKTTGNALRDSAANKIVYCAARRALFILLHRIKRRLINTPLRGNIKVSISSS
ncbi:hypothetical protein DBV15_00544 [Temnothorax longispinosus]|uniref:Uncharacterized protein n=1 Tax=Temnothorax longispinosus TaxID=300112 RepID=A0A4V3SBI8_9HYME|nr:hypothetical protein DBV15_00544 [Temnothorax longispinosus]